MARSPLTALALALCIAAAVAQHRTPASLLAPPLRPDAGYGRGDVRTESLLYPRHATGADDVRTEIGAAPRRIVSQHMSADEFFYSVVPPERVVGVSETAYDVRISNVSELANRYRPIVATDLEGIVRSNPDLVVAPASMRSDLPGLLRQAGIPVYRMFTMFETLDSIEAHIRLVGYLAGEDGRASTEVERFRSVIRRAAARRPAGARPLRVLGLGRSYSYGSRTLFTDILRTLGAENIAATHGLVGYDRVTDEHIVRWDPDWIVAGADRGTADQIRAQLLARPSVASTTAARNGHIVVLDNRVFLPLSPFTAELVDALSRAFYGEGAERADGVEGVS
jgi:iron complex transport system substrate-binding protein